jgi:glycosyltransferase involved in cell wall biosynthesis
MSGLVGAGPLTRERSLRVLLVVGGFPNEEQPARALFNLRAAQALAGLVETKVVFLRAWKPGRPPIRAYEYGGVSVVSTALPQLPGGSPLNAALYQYFGFGLLRSLLAHCDLIHSADACIGVIASAWARRVRVHHLTEVIGSDVNSVLPRIRKRPAVLGWERYVQGVACNSEALSHSFRALYPCVPNVETIYRGVDLQRFCPTGPSAGPLSGRAPVRFLFLGGLPPYPSLPHKANTKGGETLMAAWQAAERDLSAVEASLLMAGPNADCPQAVAWRARLRYPDRVSILGTLRPEDVPLYIRSADVIIQPSMEEGLPQVAVEASACARPVFGSDVGGLPEVIVPRQTGLILPAGDVEAWKRALVEYAGQGEVLRCMGQRARMHMEEHFDCRHYGPKMLDLYRTVLCEPLNGRN